MSKKFPPLSNKFDLSTIQDSIMVFNLYKILLGKSIVYLVFAISLYLEGKYIHPVVFEIDH